MRVLFIGSKVSLYSDGCATAVVLLLLLLLLLLAFINATLISIGFHVKVMEQKKIKIDKTKLHHAMFSICATRNRSPRV